ncbi:MAG: hypothetical protein AB8B93_16885, partial [Pseudomonadales bacterium]
TLVTPYPPVGPVRDLLDAANTLLKTDHLSIQYLQRSYDSTAWPHCKKGFFALKKKIPELLQALVFEDPQVLG